MKSVAGLLPLWMGNLPKDRVDRIVDKHLMNPAEFWTPYPVATWARSELDYCQQFDHNINCCNWLGTTWIPTNYMLMHGLMRHGRSSEAKELAGRTLSMVMAEENTREYYHGETGAGLGLNPFWGWSCLAYLMPLEFAVGYDPTDIGLAQPQKLAVDYFDMVF